MKRRREIKGKRKGFSPWKREDEVLVVVGDSGEGLSPFYISTGHNDGDGDGDGDRDGDCK